MRIFQFLPKESKNRLKNWWQILNKQTIPYSRYKEEEDKKLYHMDMQVSLELVIYDLRRSLKIKSRMIDRLLRDIRDLDRSLKEKEKVIVEQSLVFKQYQNKWSTIIQGLKVKYGIVVDMESLDIHLDGIGTAFQRKK